MTEPIHLFRPYFRVDECLEEVRECLEVGWTGLGFKTLQIEENWCKWTGYENSHFVNSSTSGLILALETLKEDSNWDGSHEVITTPLTFVSTNQAILHAGLKPVFCDVDNSLNLDPESVERAINEKTVAVMFVGIGGNPDNYSGIRDICKEYGIKLILDAAHMAGTTCDGETVGLDSDVAVYSYQAVKNLPTSDSGMICFNDKRYDHIVRKRSWVGIDADTYTRTKSSREYKWYYDVEYKSAKYHGNSISAALALVSLKYLDHDNAKRRKLADLYESCLDDVSGATIVAHGSKTEGAVVSSRHLFQIIVEPTLRDKIICYLNAHAIYPGVHYRSNLDYTLFTDYKKDKECEYAARCSESLISLPLHLGMKDEDVIRISELIGNYFKGSA